MKKEAWVITVNMGYGHMRAAYPLKDVAHNGIVIANEDELISEKERKLWEKTRVSYEAISKVKHVPLLGQGLFGLYDLLVQYISPMFPYRDLSDPNWSSRMLRHYIKKGLGKSMMDKLNKSSLPLVSTHPVPALVADYNGFKHKNYLVVTDSDINRAWVVDDPKKNKITYLAPTIHTAIRLREYGIKEEDVILSGFPLPKENIGHNESILKKDLAQRIANLDPNKVFINIYKKIVEDKLGRIPKRKGYITITYAVGGAGAQKEIGKNILLSLRESILKGTIRLNLVAGVKKDIFEYFLDTLTVLKLDRNPNVKIIYEDSKMKYFETINQSLRTTDILWTKPSEMAFYAGLGIPIIIAPPIGMHEHFNQEWLHHMGAGFVQKSPRYSIDWVMYWLNKGRFAEAAWDGWLKAPTMGTYKIESLVKGKSLKTV